MGHQVCQLLATFYVASSLALVALGDSDPIGGFRFQILSFGRTHSNHEDHFRYGFHIP
jgi:hypothetical protein